MSRRYYPSAPQHRAELVPRELAERLAAERDEAVARFERALRELQALRRHGGHAAELQRTRRRASALASERDALAEELQALSEGREDLAERLRAAEAERRELSRQLRAAEAERGELAERLRAAEAERGELAERLRAAEAEREELAERLRAAEAGRIVEDEAPRASPLGAAEADERIKRLVADLANVRRHRDEAIAAGIRAERSRLLAGIAQLRDSLQRALDMHPDPDSPWYAGLVATLHQLDQLLTREGATLVGAPGEPFNPHIHEAVATASQPGVPEGLILELHRPGLVLEDGSLVRPAQVVVST